MVKPKSDDSRVFFFLGQKHGPEKSRKHVPVTFDVFATNISVTRTEFVVEGR